MKERYLDTGFTRIIDHVPVGLAVFVNRNSLSRLYDANAYLCDLLEVEREDIQGYDFSRFMQYVHPDDVIELQSTVRRLLNNFENISTTFRFISHLTHSIHWVKLYGSAEIEDDVTTIIYCSFENITTEIDTQNRLISHLDKYHAVIAGANLVIWEYDIPERRFRANDDSFEKFNLPNTIENVPQSILKYIDPSEHEKAMEAFLQVESGMQQVSVELWFNKEYFHVDTCKRISANVSFDKSGSPQVAYIVAEDITSQKLEERKFEEFLHDTTSHNPNSRGTFHLNLTTNVCDFGQNTSPLVGRLHADGTADGFFRMLAGEITHDRDRELFVAKFSREKLLKNYEEGTTKVECNYRRLIENGEDHWVHFYIDLMQNPNTGEIEAITDAEDVNEAVISNKIMQRISDIDYDYIGVIDIDTQTATYISNNSRMISTPLNRSAPFEDVVDEFVMEHVLAAQMEEVTEKLQLSNIIKNLEQSDSYIITFTQRNPDSTDSQKQIKYFWLDETHANIIEIQIDITESYAQEQLQMHQLQEAALAADNANAAKTNFLATMSHDMRTPLNGILGFTRLAQETGSKKQINDYLNKIMVSGEFLLDLINDTLDLSKIESGNLVIHPANVRSDKLLDGLLTTVRVSAEAKNIRLNFTCDCDTVRTLYVDELHFRKIFLNLLSNAIKFTNPGGTVTFSITHIDEVKNGYPVNLKFQVIDTGVGMSEEFLPKMFEPFTQEVRNDATNTAFGTGLGLNIVKHLIDLMHGTIEVDSQLMKGTTFTVYLYIPDVDGEGDQKISLDEGPIDLEGKTVLLCEDHPLNQEIVKALLRKKSMNVLTAENGLLGAQAFAESKPDEIDAILMDIRMPVMNGLEATRSIRELTHPNARTIPIIALTANAYDEDVTAAIEAGMNTHLAKPIDPMTLYQTLSKLIRETPHN
ncbi:MAG: response regulator [Lachnospiraceae bacterium]|nr:response regulator [Lachnospiraceae bacterium]